MASAAMTTCGRTISACRAPGVCNLGSSCDLGGKGNRFAGSGPDGERARERERERERERRERE